MVFVGYKIVRVQGLDMRAEGLNVADLADLRSVRK